MSGSYEPSYQLPDFLGDETLQNLATDGANYYSDLMDRLREYSVIIGKDRVA